MRVMLSTWPGSVTWRAHLDARWRWGMMRLPWRRRVRVPSNEAR
jgi:hypothetical protein